MPKPAFPSVSMVGIDENGNPIFRANDDATMDMPADYLRSREMDHPGETFLDMPAEEITESPEAYKERYAAMTPEQRRDELVRKREGVRTEDARQKLLDIRSGVRAENPEAYGEQPALTGEIGQAQVERPRPSPNLPPEEMDPRAAATMQASQGQPQWQPDQWQEPTGAIAPLGAPAVGVQQQMPAREGARPPGVPLQKPGPATLTTEQQVAKATPPGANPEYDRQAVVSAPSVTGVIEDAELDAMADQANKEVELAKKQAQARGAGSEEMAKIEGDHQKKIADRQKAIQEDRYARIQALDEKWDQILNTKIEPKNLWDNADTHEKIGGGLVAVLGGFLQHTTGGRNMGVDMIDAWIERDLQAQKANMQVQMEGVKGKTNLLNQWIDATGDEIAGMQMAKASALAKYALELEGKMATIDASEGAAAQAAKAQAELYKRAREMRNEAWGRAMAESKFKADERHRSAQRSIARQQLAESKRQFDKREQRESLKMQMQAAKDRLEAERAANPYLNENVTVVEGLVGPTRTKTGRVYMETSDKERRKEIEGSVLNANGAITAAQKVLALGIGRDLPGGEARERAKAELASVMTTLMQHAKGVLSDKDMKFFESQLAPGGDINAIFRLATPETREKIITDFIERVETGTREKVQSANENFDYQPPRPTYMPTSTAADATLSAKTNPNFNERVTATEAMVDRMLSNPSTIHREALGQSRDIEQGLQEVINNPQTPEQGKRAKRVLSKWNRAKKFAADMESDDTSVESIARGAVNKFYPGLD